MLDKLYRQFEVLILCGFLIIVFRKLADKCGFIYIEKDILWNCLNCIRIIDNTSRR
jgi:hypothetical protein